MISIIRLSVVLVYAIVTCDSLTPGIGNSRNELAAGSSKISRRSFVIGSGALIGCSLPANAEYVRSGNDYSYSFTPPESMKESTKPLKTHLDETNFISSELKGYQYGVTVDPVRINSISEFGTAGEVAARVVTAEVNRDGVFDVTLVKDPIVEESSGSYILNYLSKGKRGDKRFICKICIAKKRLYVLTAQVKEENYVDMEKELMQVVDTFRVN